MCYTVANKATAKQLEARYRKKVAMDAPTHQANFLSGFGHPKMYIVEQDKIDIARWGLIPNFIRDEVKAKEYFVNTLNAKSETVFEKVSFKNSIIPRRCLIPVNGFFEWRDENKNKYPYYIKLKDQDIFSFAGVYDTWTNINTGDLTTTFSIITTEANPLMAKIHNLKKRMPFILTEENESRWLDQSLSQQQIIDMMQPLDEDEMVAHTVKKINPKTVDILCDDLLKEYEYPELALFD